jgi:hypothetical protein
VDRSTVRGVELSGALLEADTVVIAMGALVADDQTFGTSNVLPTA